MDSDTPSSSAYPGPTLCRCAPPWDDVTVRSELALSLFQEGDYERVIQVLEPIKSSLSLNPELSRAYATALVKTGKPTLNPPNEESQEQTRFDRQSQQTAVYSESRFLPQLCK
jgi:hypothetical protein